MSYCTLELFFTIAFRGPREENGDIVLYFIEHYINKMYYIGSAIYMYLNKHTS